MKKRIALLMTAMLAVTAVSPFAYADEADPGTTPDNPVEISYEDVDASVYDGTWVSTGLGFDMYLPSDWILTEISDEEAQQGLVFRAGEDGGGANVCITYTALPEEVADTYDYEQLGTELAASTTTALFMDLSGIPAVVFENDDTKVSGFSILPGDGTLINGVISAPSDDEYEEYGPYIQNMVFSISPTVAEETEAATE